MLNDTNNEILSGHVKWFNAEKGYGFVTCNDVDSDILLPATALTAFGQSSVAEESAIMFLYRETPRGFQIVSIYAIESPAISNDQTLIEESERTDSPLVPARVKWFNSERGFGFANVFTDATDIFLHADILRRNGLTKLVEGEAICLRYSDRENGRIATQVINWKLAEIPDQNESCNFMLKLA